MHNDFEGLAAGAKVNGVYNKWANWLYCKIALQLQF
jgi:hypothetical protein